MNIGKTKMPKHKYILNSRNLFEDNCEEDHSDITQPTNSFRSRFPPLQPKQKPSSDWDPREQQQNSFLEKKREIEQRTLDSASRGLCLLHDSEKIGIATAEELVCQGEILIKAKNRLDIINPNLKKSEKHIKSINSVLYSIKNYISGKSDSKKIGSQNTHSLPRVRSKNRTLDPIEKLSRRSLSDCNYTSHPNILLCGPKYQVESKTVSDSFDMELADKLNDSMEVIARLKNLGLAIADEIDSQDKIIDSISDGMNEADMKINNQNKKMKKILLK